MERMSDYKKEFDLACEKIVKLEEENKKLNDDLRYYKEKSEFLNNVIVNLEEENKKLNIKIASLEGEIKGLNYTIEKLKEENQTLELWLDNKEKLNEEYRNQIDLLKCQSYGPSELADSLYDADKTIEKLREEIKEIEKNQEYRYHRCMKAERQVQHSLGGDDELIYEEGLYD